MKIILIITITVLTVNGLSVEEQWKVFKENYGKQYRSRLEETKRFQIFKENVDKVEEHNRKFELGKFSYKLGINKFADLTEEEFNERLTPKPSFGIGKSIALTDIDNFNVPNEIDWRQQGAVTKVKDQGACGACWAFAANAALESHYLIKTGKTISLSEQYLVDCDYMNNGCMGGWTMNAYRTIRDKGTVTEEDYPYEATKNVCKVNGTLFKDMGFVTIQQDENVMKAVVANIGPIAVAIDASELYLYAGGVYDNVNCRNDFTNHVVLIVGFGTTAEGVDYWEVKNSWGDNWGDDGFGKMSRNKNSQCAIASDALYPLI